MRVTSKRLNLFTDEAMSFTDCLDGLAASDLVKGDDFIKEAFVSLAAAVANGFRDSIKDKLQAEMGNYDSAENISQQRHKVL